MRCQVAYLQRHVAASETPLSSFKKAIKCQQIRGDDITAAIRAVVQAAGPAIRFTEADISARSLQAGGDMDLLVVWVDPDTIRLVGVVRAIRCSAIPTQQQRVSQKASARRCSNMVHTRSFCRLKPTTSAKWHSRALKDLFTRELGGLVKDQCGLGIANDCLFLNQQLVPSGTQGPLKDLFTRELGGLVQDQCGLGDINIAFFLPTNILSSLVRYNA